MPKYLLMLMVTLLSLALAGCGAPPAAAPSATPLPPTAQPAVPTPEAAPPTQSHTVLPPTPETPVEPTLTPAEAPFTVQIDAFGDGQAMPKDLTCDDANLSPAVVWGKPPAGAKSLALVVEDPDAPGGVFTHWLIYNIPLNLAALEEALPQQAQLTGMGEQGINDFGKTGYNGPCPPAGKPHHYAFKLYALDLPPALKPGLNAAGFKAAVQGHILAEAQWQGLYGR